jgi:FecR protein
MFKKYAFILLSASLYLVSPAAFAANVAGTIERLQGSANVVGSSGQKALATSAEVFQGDQINTAADAELLLRMTDGTVIAMRPNSNLIVSEYHFDKNDSNNDNIFVRLLKGGLRTVTGAIGKKNPQKVRFSTPTATIGIRGTDFEIAVIDENKKEAEAGTYNKVFQGTTYIENSQGKSVDVNENQAAFSPANALQMAQQFGLLKQVPNVFFNGKYDNLLDLLQKETLNRLNSELGSKIPSGVPSQVKDLIPKLGDLF